MKRTVVLILLILLSAFSIIGCNVESFEAETTSETYVTDETNDNTSTQGEAVAETETDIDSLTEVSEKDTEKSDETVEILTKTVTEDITEAPSEKETEEETTEAVKPIVDITDTLYSYSDLQDDLEKLSVKYPDLFSYGVIGTTHEGRNIYSATLGNKNSLKNL